MSTFRAAGRRLTVLLFLSAPWAVAGQTVVRETQPTDTVPSIFSSLSASSADDDTDWAGPYTPSTGFPSIESTALARSISIPMDYYTGRANVRIPLYDIPLDGLNIPVSLSYQSSGIKIEDYATWVGLGWNLEAGGSVTRIVRRFPDEHGYCKTDGRSHADMVGDLIGISLAPLCGTGKANQDEFDATAPVLDGEPDLFFFQIPGASGMFVFDGQRKAHTIPYQDISIEWKADSSFVITDPRGNVYRLGSTESSRERSKDVSDVAYVSREYISTWFLDGISNPHGHSLATFGYQSGREYNTVYINGIYRLCCENGTIRQVDGRMLPDQTQKTLIKPKYLTEIRWAGGRLVFRSQQESRYLTRTLTDIRIINAANNLLKTIRLEYGSFPHDRMRLDAVREIYAKQVVTLCTFDYNTETFLPARDSKAFDHWGYYNGIEDKLPYPNCYITEKGFSVRGGDRSPSLQHTLACVLRRINYPNGRYRKFVYTQNRGSEAGGSTHYRIGGLAIASITDDPGDGSPASIVRYDYLAGEIPAMDKNECLWMHSKYNRYGVYYKSSEYKTDFRGLGVGYTKVKETMPDGSYNIYEYTSFGAAPDELGEVCRADQGTSFYPDTDGRIQRTTAFYRRGLLTRKSSFDATGAEVEVETASYTYMTRSPKAVIPALVLYYENTNRKKHEQRYAGRYYWRSQAVELKEVIVSGSHRVPTHTVLSYNDYGYPSKIRVSDASGNVTVTEMTYPTDYEPFLDEFLHHYTMSYALYNMRQNGIHALPVETVTYRNGDIVGAELNTYFYKSNGGVFRDTVYALNLQNPLPAAGFVKCGLSYGQVFSRDSRYKPVRIDDTFGVSGRTLSYTDALGDRRSVICDPDEALVLAEVDGARYSLVPGENEVYYTSFENEAENGLFRGSSAKSGDYVYNGGPLTVPLSSFRAGEYVAYYWEYDPSEGASAVWVRRTAPVTVDAAHRSFVLNPASGCYVDELRIMPRDASMTTYTYKPGVGASTVTGPDGRTSRYVYNIFGSLSREYDNERIITKKITYDDIPN